MPRRIRQLVCVASVVVPLASQAQSSPPERRVLLEQAREASDRGDHVEALRIGETAARMGMSTSLQMFLAEEHESLAVGALGASHLLSAVRFAEACIRSTETQQTLHNRDWIIHRCTVLLQRLNPRIARITVRVPTTAPTGLQVLLDGRPLPAEAWGRPQEVLPGLVVVEATHDDLPTYRRELSLRAGSHETVEVPVPTAVGGTTPAASRLGVVVGWSLIGVGAVALGVGVSQWIATSEQSSDTWEPTTPEGAAWERYAHRINADNTLSIEAGCERAQAAPATDTDAAAVRDLCDANARAVAMAWGFGVGGLVLAAGGTTLLALTRRTTNAPTTRVMVAPVLAHGVGGVVIGGAF